MRTAFAPNSSNIEWCEAVTSAYATSPRVVETWNSASSAIFCVAGLVGVLVCRAQGLGAAFAFSEAMLSVVGAGSILFHATQSLAGELLDELPMSLLAFGYLWQLDGLHWLTRPPYRARFYAANLVSVAASFAAYVFFAQHELFVLLFTAQVIVASFTLLSAASEAGVSTRWWWLFLAAILLGKICWESERALWRAGDCPPAGAASHYLHSVWHVASCVAHCASQAQHRAIVAARGGRLSGRKSKQV